jgi:hypothetical protein
MSDWMTAAARELASHFSFGGGRDSYVTDEQRENVASNYRTIIARHCPLRPDVTYFPLADVVKVLRNHGVDTECGACMEVAFTSVTTNAHTCKGRP